LLMNLILGLIRPLLDLRFKKIKRKHSDRDRGDAFYQRLLYKEGLLYGRRISGRGIKVCIERKSKC